jgi:hypothetical protein
VGDGRAEERQHGIAHQPSQRTLVAVHWLDENVEGAAHDLYDILRIQLLGHSGGAFDIAEQDRDRAAFVMYLPACRQQPLGVLLGYQALDSVGNADSWLLRLSWRNRHLRTAFQAELGADG